MIGDLPGRPGKVIGDLPGGGGRRGRVRGGGGGAQDKAPACSIKVKTCILSILSVK